MEETTIGDVRTKRKINFFSFIDHLLLLFCRLIACAASQHAPDTGNQLSDWPFVLLPLSIIFFAYSPSFPPLELWQEKFESITRTKVEFAPSEPFLKANKATKQNASRRKKADTVPPCDGRGCATESHQCEVASIRSCDAARAHNTARAHSHPCPVLHRWVMSWLQRVVRFVPCLGGGPADAADAVGCGGPLPLTPAGAAGRCATK